jgi:SAM-dependent methyltransferase
MSATAPHCPFDELAADYDRGFTHTSIGGLLRQATHRRLAARFPLGQRVLELNCGTGEDALFLGRRGVRVLATDSSERMVEVARRKVEAANLGTVVEVRRLALDELDELEAPPFDGALSNFGGLNCVADLASVARALAARLRSGAVVLLSIMGPVVPWEWLWFLARGEPAKAFRRLRPGGTEWRGLTIRYPSVGRTRRSFAPAFRLLRVSGLGVFLPPPYAEPWAARVPRLLACLDRGERLLEALPPLPRLADHYLMELERV